MARRTLVLLNPHAGRLRREPALGARIAALVRGRAELAAPSGLAELDALAARALDHERVVVVSGDGGTARALGALARAAERSGVTVPELWLAPAGTVCTTPRALGQRRSVLGVLRAALAEGARHRVQWQPTLRVTADDEAPLYGFTFGTGLVARFFEAYVAEARPGFASAFRLAVGAFVGGALGVGRASADATRARGAELLAPVPLSLSVDGERLPHEAYSLVLSSVLPEVGLGFRPLARAGEDPERPAIVASTRSARALAAVAHRALRGVPLGGAGDVDALVREAVLEFRARGGGAFVLDGELERAGWVELRAGPRERIAIAE